jgi:hypothetical protein
MLDIIDIELTSICCFDCTFCGIPKNRKRQHMSNDMFEEILNQIYDADIKSIWLTPKCGDVFCDPQIYEKFNILRKFNFQVRFFSNFYMPDIDRLNTYKDVIDYIYVSEYGTSDKEFEILTRKPRSFRKKVYENKNKCRIPIQFHRRSQEYMDEFHNNMSKIGICEYGLRPGITLEGDFIPCYCGDYKCLLSFGNIKDKTIKEIMNSDEYMDFVTNQIGGATYLKEPCLNCDMFERGKLTMKLLRRIHEWKSSKL